jgi:hypothetical protein
MSSPTSWSFPFFGAGEATYFEWAELHVLFEREPSEAERAAIEQDVPLALCDSKDWEGAALMVASDQFAHAAIAQQFAREDDEDEDDDEEDDDDDDDDDDEYGSRWFFASSAAVHRFNEAIEAWLQAAHAIVPIVLAFRREDGESGGTELSPWHAWSVQRLPDMLPQLRDAIAAGGDQHRYVIAGVVDMAREADVALPQDVIDWADPDVPVARALAAGDAGQLAALLGQGDAMFEALAHVVQPNEPEHARALLGNAELMLARELDDDEALPLLLAALAYPREPGAEPVIAANRARVDDELAWANVLAYQGYLRISEAREFEVAIELFELILARTDLDRSAYANALYVVMNDNNGLPIDTARHRRFLAAALPHGPANPAIFFNAACVAIELGEIDQAFACISAAIEHEYERLELIVAEPMLVRLHEDPRWAALLDAAGEQAKKAAKKKAAKKKQPAKKKASKKAAKKKPAKKQPAKKQPAKKPAKKKPAKKKPAKKKPAKQPAKKPAKKKPAKKQPAKKKPAKKKR